MTFQFCKEIRTEYRLARMGVKKMKDLYQVLRQKELDLERTRTEIEALRSVIPLLSEELDGGEKGRPPVSTNAAPTRRTSGAD